MEDFEECLAFYQAWEAAIAANTPIIREKYKNTKEKEIEVILTFEVNGQVEKRKTRFERRPTVLEDLTKEWFESWNKLNITQ